MINQFPRVSRVSLLSSVFPPGSLRSRLPDHYKQRHLDKLNNLPDVLHQVPYEAKYRLDAETGFRLSIQDPPVRTLRPPMFDRVLFGGERVIDGYHKPSPKNKDRHGPFSIIDEHMHKKIPRFWFPEYKVEMFFSEILNEYLMIPVTDSTLDQIDKCAGFDFYILKTKERNLDSRLGECLKKRMNAKLIYNEPGPADDPGRRVEIMEKYKDLIIPEDRAEWLGLTLQEACAKQMAIEAQAQERIVVPLKYLLAKQIFDEVKAVTFDPSIEDDDDNFIGRMFKSKK